MLFVYVIFYANFKVDFETHFYDMISIIVYTSILMGPMAMNVLLFIYVVDVFVIMAKMFSLYHILWKQILMNVKKTHTTVLSTRRKFAWTLKVASGVLAKKDIFGTEANVYQVSQCFKTHLAVPLSKALLIVQNVELSYTCLIF